MASTTPADRAGGVHNGQLHLSCQTRPVTTPARRFPWAAVVLGIALLVLAGCLRAGVTSIGVLLPQLRSDLGFGPATVGLLTSLPVLCFAVVGLGAGGVILRLGVHRATVLLLAAIAIGLATRAWTDSAAGFLVATAVAMMGVALGNVVLPPLTRRHFPNRVPLISALYAATLLTGATIAASTSAPIAAAFDSWRVALGGWALLAVLGLLLWLPTALRERPQPPIRGTTTPDSAGHNPRFDVSFGQVARSKVGWALALLFGAQSSQAYVQFGYWADILADSGVDATHAGALLGVMIAIAIPITLSLPVLMRFTGRGLVLPVGFAALTAAGWVGILTAPLALGGWPWAICLGTGGAAFTWCLAMIGLRARTHDGSAHLSAFVQGTGYLLAATATFSAGLLREVTGSWTVPLGMLLVLTAVMGVAGSVAVRSGPVEDELPRSGGFEARR